MHSAQEVGDLALDAMRDLEADFPEGKVRSVAIVVEMDTGEKPTTWSVYSSDDRLWYTRVVLEMGLGSLDIAEVVECDTDEGDTASD